MEASGDHVCVVNMTTRITHHRHSLPLPLPLPPVLCPSPALASSGTPAQRQKLKPSVLTCLCTLAGPPLASPLLVGGPPPGTSGEGRLAAGLCWRRLCPCRARDQSPTKSDALSCCSCRDANSPALLSKTRPAQRDCILLDVWRIPYRVGCRPWRWSTQSSTQRRTRWQNTAAIDCTSDRAAS